MWVRESASVWTLYINEQQAATKTENKKQQQKL